MSSAIVYSEDANLQAELAGAAIKAGAAATTFDPAGLPDTDTATLALAIAAAATKANATLVLVGATKRGKDIAPRVAAHLEWPFAADVSELGNEGGSFTVARMVLSGNSKATYRLGAQAVCSALPKFFEPGQASGSVKGVAQPSTVKVVGRQPEKHSDFDLAAAPVVIGVGRGFKVQADLKLADQLAASFPGGAVGCSRPIAADLKWLGEEHWIGLSGHAIKPKAYIACGISGQIQHIAGIRGAKLIVAINTNKDAPIMQVADYAVVGDLYQVIPKLVAGLKR